LLFINMLKLHADYKDMIILSTIRNRKLLQILEIQEIENSHASLNGMVCIEITMVVNVEVRHGYI
jgi:hypothetical protein